MGLLHVGGSWPRGIMASSELARGGVTRLAAASALAIVALLFAHAAEAPGAQAQVLQLQLAAAPSLPPPPPLLRSRTLRLARGDTLQGALSDAGVAASDVKAAVDALKPVFAPRDFQTG